MSAEKEVPDVEAAWAGARDIVAERIADERRRPGGPARAGRSTRGCCARSRSGEGNEPERLKFKDYFDFAEPAAKLPSHRILALRRGENEGFLRLALEVDRDAGLAQAARRCSCSNARRGRWPATSTRRWSTPTTGCCAPSIELDVRLALKERADAEAIRVFAENLRHLLLAAPLGGKRAAGARPGLSHRVQGGGAGRDRQAAGKRR